MVKINLLQEKLLNTKPSVPNCKVKLLKYIQVLLSQINYAIDKV